MLLLPKKILKFYLFLVLMLATSCGFVPISQMQVLDKGSQQILASIAPKFENKDHQLAEQYIYDSFKKKVREQYPVHEDDAEYIILVKNFNKISSGLRVDNDGNYNTYKMRISIKYEIIRVADGKVLGDDEIEVNSNYNINNSIYITEISEQETTDNLLDILVNRLSDSLLLTIACN